MAQAWQLAQINVGRRFGLPGDPRVQGFYGALDHVNALADAAPGFVWRLQDETGNATAFQPSPAQPGAPIDMQPDPWCAGRA